MKVLIDTNIILDILLERAPFLKDTVKLFEKIESNELKGFITANSVTDIIYIARKKYWVNEIKVVILNLLNTIKIISIDEHDIIDALILDFSDFEDALQCQCSIKAKMDYIITRNEKDFKNSKIPAISTVQLLNLLWIKINLIFLFCLLTRCVTSVIIDI